MKNNECCIANVLKVICVLQNKIERVEDIPASCDRPFLGEVNNNECLFNTRPLTFYNCNNELFTVPFTLENGSVTETGTSTVFRIEKIDGCCATCRVLASNPDTSSNFPFVATDSFCTINTRCCCALRCLPDTFIACI